MVVGGGFGEVWPFGPGASAPMGARGGVCDQWLVVGPGRFGPSAPAPLLRWGRGEEFVISGWWWVWGGLALRPRSLSPVGGEGWILWLVVCPGRFGPLAPALLALRGRGVEVCDQKNWEES